MGASWRKAWCAAGNFNVGRLNSSPLVCQFAGSSQDEHSKLHRSVQIGIAMKQVTFTELRKQAKLYFGIVAAGESVRVLRDGKPDKRV